MVETYADRVHTEHVVLDIGEGVGALILYAPDEVRGTEIEITFKKGNDTLKTHTGLWLRRFNGRTICAGVFPSLPAGEYNIWWSAPQPICDVTIVGGEVTEVDCRGLIDITTLPTRLLQGHEHSYIQNALSSRMADLLPPRYLTCETVSAAPMGTAALMYTEDGQVAWDEMWAGFCDLALAGGPSHRGILLEPVMPDEVRIDMTAYERVVAEIERGLRMITNLPVLRSEKPGWVGLQCTDEEMALWMVRTIIVENVCVRREGRVLYLPAGPTFALEKEIKNVITVVAKTHHYWTEHCNAKRSVSPR